ncbi:MAG: hypothetical protein ACLR9W_09860 [Enterobacter hormaechei]
MQVQDNGRPRVELIGVSTLFGLVPPRGVYEFRRSRDSPARSSSPLKPHTASPAIVHALRKPGGGQVTCDLRAFQLNTRQDSPR